MAHDTASKAQKNEANQRNADLQALLKDPRFRRVVRGWIRDTGIIDEEAFTGGSETYYRLGRQAVGRDIKREIEAADKYGFVLILKELVDDE